MNFTFENLSAWLEISIFGNDVQAYGIAFGVFLTLFIGINIFRVLLLHYLSLLAKNTNNTFDDFLVSLIYEIRWYFYLGVYVYFPVQFLILHSFVEKSITGIFIFFVLLQVIILILKVLEYVFQTLLDSGDRKKAANTTTLHLFKLLAQILVWGLGILLILSNIGFEITPLLASLGVMGIAVGFALQNIIEDIFSSFSIYFDKPFGVEDFIQVGSKSGVVQKIGMKTTRLKTLQGEEIIISNKQLTNAEIHNYTRMHRRRVVGTIGVTYETALEKLKTIPNIIQKVCEESGKSITFDRAHMQSLEDWSITFEYVYYVEKSDYTLYMDAQQTILLNILQQFSSHHIDLAYPTQMVYHNSISGVKK